MSLPKKRFWQRVEERTNRNGPIIVPELGPCWEYIGSKDKAGYPLVYYGGLTKRLSRLVYESIHGKIPFGWDVHHKCTNRSCIRDTHLEGKPEDRHYKDCHPANTRCGKGHLLNGKGYCEVCNRDRANLFYLEKKNATI